MYFFFLVLNIEISIFSHVLRYDIDIYKNIDIRYIAFDMPTTTSYNNNKDDRLGTQWARLLPNRRNLRLFNKFILYFWHPCETLLKLNLKYPRFVSFVANLTLQKIANWMSKNCQKLDIFFKKIAKMYFFNVKFLQFFDIQLKIFPEGQVPI